MILIFEQLWQVFHVWYFFPVHPSDAAAAKAEALDEIEGVVSTVYATNPATMLVGSSEVAAICEVFDDVDTHDEWIKIFFCFLQPKSCFLADDVVLYGTET